MITLPVQAFTAVTKRRIGQFFFSPVIFQKNTLFQLYNVESGDNTKNTPPSNAFSYFRRRGILSISKFSGRFRLLHTLNNTLKNRRLRRALTFKYQLFSPSNTNLSSLREVPPPKERVIEVSIVNCEKYQYYYAKIVYKVLGTIWKKTYRKILITF